MSTCSFCKSIGKHFLSYCSHDNLDCNEMKACVFLFCRENKCVFTPYNENVETFVSWRDKHIRFHQTEGPNSYFKKEFPKYIEKIQKFYDR